MTDRLSGRIAFLLAAVACLLVLLLGWFVLVSPQRSKIDTLNTKIGSTQIQIANTQAYLKSPAARSAPLKLKQLQAAFPADVRMSQILRQLSAMSAKSGVSLDSVSPGAPAAAIAGQSVPINLSVQGHYFNLVNFLHRLRTSAVATPTGVVGSGRLYSVSNVTMSPGGTDGTLSATVAASAYISTPSALPAVTPSSTDTSTSTTGP